MHASKRERRAEFSHSFEGDYKTHTQASTSNRQFSITMTFPSILLETKEKSNKKERNFFISLFSLLLALSSAFHASISFEASHRARAHSNSLTGNLLKSRFDFTLKHLMSRQRALYVVVLIERESERDGEIERVRDREGERVRKREKYRG